MAEDRGDMIAGAIVLGTVIVAYVLLRVGRKIARHYGIIGEGYPHRPYQDDV